MPKDLKTLKAQPCRILPHSSPFSFFVDGFLPYINDHLLQSPGRGRYKRSPSLVDCLYHFLEIGITNCIKGYEIGIKPPGHSLFGIFLRYLGPDIAVGAEAAVSVPPLSNPDRSPSPSISSFPSCRSSESLIQGPSHWPFEHVSRLMRE